MNTPFGVGALCRSCRLGLILCYTSGKISALYLPGLIHSRSTTGKVDTARTVKLKLITDY